MRFFTLLLLQVLLLLPFTSLAADGGKAFLLQDHRTIELREAQKAGVVNAYGKLPLYFIKNNGQLDAQVSFYERGAGHATFFTEKGVVIALTKNAGSTDKVLNREALKSIQNEKQTTEALRLSFVGGNEKAVITAGDLMPGHVNYFVGNDKTKWRSNVPTYGALTYEDVYKNIDIRFYGNNRQLEHDIIVRPGGDPSLVRFAYDGIKGLKVNEAGELEVSLDYGKLIEQRPVIYQEIKGKRVAVEGSYRLLKGEAGVFTYGFTVASYDHTRDLVIDPVFVYSTYLGGSDSDIGLGIAVDNTGAAYITGHSSSIDFPLVSPIQAIGSADVFVTKIDPLGAAYVYSTYLGGNGNDKGYDITVDSSGSVYLTGYTASTDFPLMNPIQGTIGGGADAFVTKIDPAGASVVYSTYLGGSNIDIGDGIAVDNSGVAYVMGWTYSTDFPLMNPIQGTFGGGADVFVTKIDPAGAAYIFSTYLGGTNIEIGGGIALDISGAVYLTGYTYSTDFPLMSPIQGTLGGAADVFATKIDPLGAAYVYSTYLGGSNIDMGGGIALDNSGYVYLTGYTYSTDFPLMSPIQGTFGGVTDAFVTKIDPAGAAYVYSTYLGGNKSDFGQDIAVDNSGVAYVTGYTWSTDFPLMSPIQGTLGGTTDAFVTNIDPAGAALVFSTYLGGSNTDFGNGIAVDDSGVAYLTGWTYSTDFPLMSPIQGTFGGVTDAFVIKAAPAPSAVVTLAITPDAASFARGSIFGYTVTVTNSTAARQCFRYWEDVTLPNGVKYPARGALFGPVRICLKAKASKTAHLTHGISMRAQVGTYIFNAFTGAYPNTVVSEAHFNLNVTNPAAPTPTPQTSWRLIENGFSK